MSWNTLWFKNKQQQKILHVPASLSPTSEHILVNKTQAEVMYVTLQKYPSGKRENSDSTYFFMVAATEMVCLELKQIPLCWTRGHTWWSNKKEGIGVSDIALGDLRLVCKWKGILSGVFCQTYSCKSIIYVYSFSSSKCQILPKHFPGLCYLMCYNNPAR